MHVQIVLAWPKGGTISSNSLKQIGIPTAGSILYKTIHRHTVASNWGPSLGRYLHTYLLLTFIKKMGWYQKKRTLPSRVSLLLLKIVNCWALVLKGYISPYKCCQDQFLYMQFSCWLNAAPSVHRDKQWWIKLFRAMQQEYWCFRCNWTINRACFKRCKSPEYCLSRLVCFAQPFVHLVITSQLKQSGYQWKRVIHNMLCF